MFKFNTKYFLIGLIFILAINYKTFYQFSSTTSTSSSGSTLIVETGSIENTIEVSGDSELVDEQSLKFTKEGTITKVTFKAGDTVKKGDIIAELDNTDVYDSIEQAQISLDNANISYKQLFDEPDKSQILQSKNAITSAENSLEIAKKEYENLKTTQQNSLTQLEKNIETSKGDLETSKTNLELSKKQLETLKQTQQNSLSNTVSNKSTTVINIENTLKTNLSEIENIIEQSDYIMGVSNDNKDKNNSYENYLGAKDLAVKSKATASLLSSISLYEDLKSTVSKYNYDGNISSIKTLLTKYLNVYNDLADTTDLIYKTLDNSVESDGALSDSDIQTKKSIMSSYRTTAQNKSTTINSSLNTLDTLSDTDLISQSNSNTIEQTQVSITASELSIKKQEISIENSEKDLETTKENYRIALETKQKDIDSKERSLELANISYDELMDGPTSDEIQKSKNSIKQAELNLESAYKKLDDYKLEAPFDGVVRKIDYMLGDNITTDTDKYVYIENPDLLVITVMLDQIDITKVKLGQEAKVVFDAYSTTTVKAEISSIDTQPVETSGVVSYEVKLVLNDDTFDKKILSGMGADIEIIVESKKDILVLKTSAITEKDGKSYVNVLKNGKQVETEIVTGINGDGVTEIASGLEAGDQVVTADYVSSSSNDTTTSTSLFGPSSKKSSSSSSSNSSSNRDFGPPGGF
ncbi:MAG: efflux RND transporter periplasmic adaptor subunit [Candidatus Gracilibacteria bacterium]|nr:efflux RND transporter periplasmic adaptor subunit [Candidatus Gracilibacteria bacterium]